MSKKTWIEKKERKLIRNIVTPWEKRRNQYFKPTTGNFTKDRPKGVHDLDPKIQLLLKETGTNITDPADLQALASISVQEKIELYESIARGLSKLEALRLLTSRLLKKQQDSKRLMNHRKLEYERKLIELQLLDLWLEDKEIVSNTQKKSKKNELRNVNAKLRIGGYDKTEIREFEKQKENARQCLEKLQVITTKISDTKKLLEFLFVDAKAILQEEKERSLKRLKKREEKDRKNFDIGLKSVKELLKEYNLLAGEEAFSIDSIQTLELQKIYKRLKQEEKEILAVFNNEKVRIEYCDKINELKMEKMKLLDNLKKMNENKGIINTERNDLLEKLKKYKGDNLKNFEKFKIVCDQNVTCLKEGDELLEVGMKEIKKLDGKIDEVSSAAKNFTTSTDYKNQTKYKEEAEKLIAEMNVIKSDVEKNENDFKRFEESLNKVKKDRIDFEKILIKELKQRDFEKDQKLLNEKRKISIQMKEFVKLERGKLEKVKKDLQTKIEENKKENDQAMHQLLQSTIDLVKNESDRLDDIEKSAVEYDSFVEKIQEINKRILEEDLNIVDTTKLKVKRKELLEELKTKNKELKERKEGFEKLNKKRIMLEEQEKEIEENIRSQKKEKVYEERIATLDGHRKYFKEFDNKMLEKKKNFGGKLKILLELMKSFKDRIADSPDYKAVLLKQKSLITQEIAKIDEIKKTDLHEYDTKISDMVTLANEIKNETDKKKEMSKEKRAKIKMIEINDLKESIGYENVQICSIEDKLKEIDKEVKRIRDLVVSGERKKEYEEKEKKFYEQQSNLQNMRLLFSECSKRLNNETKLNIDEKMKSDFAKEDESYKKLLKDHSLIVEEEIAIIRESGVLLGSFESSLNELNQIDVDLSKMLDDIEYNKLKKKRDAKNEEIERLRKEAEKKKKELEEKEKKLREIEEMERKRELELKKMKEEKELQQKLKAINDEKLLISKKRKEFEKFIKGLKKDKVDIESVLNDKKKKVDRGTKKICKNSIVKIDEEVKFLQTEIIDKVFAEYEKILEENLKIVNLMNDEKNEDLLQGHLDREKDIMSQRDNMKKEIDGLFKTTIERLNEEKEKRDRLLKVLKSQKLSESEIVIQSFLDLLDEYDDDVSKQIPNSKKELVEIEEMIAGEDIKSEKDKELLNLKKNMLTKQIKAYSSFIEYLKPCKKEANDINDNEKLNGKEKLGKIKPLKKEFEKQRYNLKSSIDFENSKYKKKRDEFLLMKEHEFIQVKQHQVNINSFVTKEFLNKQFMVVKYDPKKQFVSKRARLFEVDFFQKIVKDLKITGKVQKKLEFDDLLTAERYWNKHSVLRVLFSEAKNSYALHCRGNYERENLFSLLSSIKPLCFSWCPPLCKEGEKRCKTKVVGKYKKPENYKGKSGKFEGEFELKVTSDPYEDCFVWCGTWNLEKDKPKPNIWKKIIPLKNKFDMYVIAIQNCPWKKAGDVRNFMVNKVFNPDKGGREYVAVNCEQVNGNCVIVIANIFATYKISNSMTSVVRSSSEEKDKWCSVGISLSYDECNLLFIGSTFPCSKDSDREKVYKKTVEGLRNGYENVTFFNQFHYTFWLGDFGYPLRYDKNVKKYLSYQKPDIGDIISHYDMLTGEIKREGVMIDFKESEINFKPTFPYHKKTKKLMLEDPKFIPSYRSRIFYKSYDGFPVNCIKYEVNNVHFYSFGGFENPCHTLLSGIYKIRNLLPYNILPVGNKKGQIKVEFKTLHVQPISTSGEIFKYERLRCFLYCHFSGSKGMSKVMSNLKTTISMGNIAGVLTTALSSDGVSKMFDSVGIEENKINDFSWNTDELPSLTVNIRKEVLEKQFLMIGVKDGGDTNNFDNLVATSVLPFEKLVESMNQNRIYNFSSELFDKFGKRYGTISGGIRLKEVA